MRGRRRTNTSFSCRKERAGRTSERSTSQIGDALNKAAAAIEDENPLMEGVIESIDFNSDKLGDVKQRDGTLQRLIQHFSTISMKSSDLENLDMLGDVYEYLIEQFADDAGKKGGEFYTPRMVVKLIVRLLQPKEGMKICDPTCGSGGMLIECAHYVKEHRWKSEGYQLIRPGEKRGHVEYLQDEYVVARIS